MSRILLAAAVGLTLALLPSPAEACRCIPPTVDSSFNSNDGVMTVRITSRITRVGKVLYGAEVITSYKGCYAPGDVVTFSTTNSSASCGLTTLRAGQSYLLFGYTDGRTLAIDTCDYNKSIREVTPEDEAYLEANAEPCS